VKLLLFLNLENLIFLTEQIRLKIKIFVKEETMSKDFCMDCGMLLSPHTSICSVCGHDNNYDDLSDITLDMDQLIDMNDDFVPEYYPGF
jgi:hypothetical protein